MKKKYVISKLYSKNITGCKACAKRVKIVLGKVFLTPIIYNNGNILYHIIHSIYDISHRSILLSYNW